MRSHALLLLLQAYLVIVVACSRVADACAPPLAMPNAWLASPAKTESLVTVLLGNASAHERLVRDTLALHPPQPPLVVAVHAAAGESTLKAVIAVLRDSCALGKCPHMTILVHQAQLAESWDVEQMRSGLFSTRQCVAGDFGGFKADCSAVWFVLSADFGASALRDSLADGEPDAASDDELLADARVAMRARWRQTSFPASALVHFVRGEPASAAFARPARAVRGASGPIPVPPSPAFFRAMGFIGQDHAVNAVASALLADARGLKTSRAPIVFLFLGPAGVGKTMLARLVASARHGGRAWKDVAGAGGLAVFSMVNYKNAEDVDSFVSPRQGLKGEGAMLRVFERDARPVVVLDEVEKAHATLMQEMLLPWLDDDGFVQDKKDAAVQHATKDAVFVLTSNCFADAIAKEMALVRIGKKPLRAAYDTIARSFVGNHSARCHRDGRGENPFARPELLRRLRTGHENAEADGVALGNFGFVLFEQPGEAQIDAAVEAEIADVHARFAPGGGGLHVTRKAKDRLRAAAAAGGEGGLALVGSAVRGELARALGKSAFECADGAAHVVVALARGALQASAQCVGTAATGYAVGVPSVVVAASEVAAMREPDAVAVAEFVALAAQAPVAVRGDEARDEEPAEAAEACEEAHEAPETLVAWALRWATWVAYALALLLVIAYVVMPLVQLASAVQFALLLGLVFIAWPVLGPLVTVVAAAARLVGAAAAWAAESPGLAAGLFGLVALQWWWWRYSRRRRA